MKHWIILLVVLLVVSNGFWIFRFIDIAITETYTKATHELTDQMYNQLLVISNLNLVGVDVNEAKVKIGKDIHGLDLFEKEGCLFAGQICLQIGDNRTIEVIRGPNP